MTRHSGDELLALPVRLHGIQLGRPVDLLLDRRGLRVVGLDVLCGDDVHRFLPLPIAAIADGAITIQSPLVMLEEDELDFYRSRAFALSSLRGRLVTRKGKELGTLRDVVVGAGGVLVSVVVDTDGRSEQLPFDGSLTFAPESRSAA
jgi:hypothetical protein